jgi:hypothetical protein
MSLRRLLPVLSVLMSAVLSLLFTGPIQAGGRCDGDCYVKDAPPVIHRTWRKRIEIEQGVYSISREPAQYGWARSKVRLPREWHVTPAVYKTVMVTKRRPTRYVWEKRMVKGREVMCKVKLPGERVTVEKQVLVAPARRVAVSGPRYAYTERRVLIRPYKNIATYHPARHVYTSERVAIQPEGYVWRKARRSELWD